MTRRKIASVLLVSTLLFGATLLLAEDKKTTPEKSAPAKAAPAKAAPKSVEKTPTGKVLSQTANGTRSAGNTFDGRKQNVAEPVKGSTSTANAQQIAARENAAEKKREQERARKSQLDKGNVPAPK